MAKSTCDRLHAVRCFAGAALAAVAHPVCAASSAATPPLVLESTVPLANVSGRIDHLAIDLRRNRLFVAELGNNSLDVVDLGSGKPIHRIDGLDEPQGVAYAPQSDRIVIANGGDGSVKIYSGADYSLQKTLSLGDDADDARLDPGNGQVLIGYGSGGIAVVDPASGEEVRKVVLPGHPEGFQLDPRTGHVFVNVPSVHEIALADTRTGAAIGRRNPAKLSANFPMALVERDMLVAVAFRGPHVLALFDMKHGNEVGSAETCADADDIFFDQKRSRFYVSCGAGDVAVYDVEFGRLEFVGNVKTGSGARTSLFVPELDRLFVAVPAGWFASNAALQVFRPSP